MLTFDKTITVYNSIFNKETGFFDYYRTVLNKCSWFGKNRVSVIQGGTIENKYFNVRILDDNASDKQRVEPNEYKHPSTQYTFNLGDIIVLGVGVEAPTNAKEYTELLTNNINAFQITDIHNNSRIALKHIYIEGK